MGLREIMRFVLAVAPMALVVSLGLGTAALAGDGQEDAKNVKKVKVIKVSEDGECEGEECAKTEHHRIIIKKGGDIHAAHEMMGEACEGDCVEEIIIEEGGDLHEIHALVGRHLAMEDQGCEGEDCKKMHRMIMKAHGDTHVMRHHGSAIFSGEGRKGGFLGIYLTELTAELRTHFGAPADQGVMVGKVVAGSAAEEAGLEVGDVVTSVDGRPVDSAASLVHAVNDLEAGSPVDLGVWRGGAEQKLTAVLGERPGGESRKMRKIMVRCEEGDEDCDVAMDSSGMDYDCGDAEECKIEVECRNDECACVVNGDPVDCEELNLPHHE